jgi:hypothetical protein
MVLPILAATLLSLAARGGEKPVIADKTFIAWVAPANLSQRGGSALTLEKSGGTFDAIVSEMGFDAQQPLLNESPRADAPGVDPVASGG